MYRGVEFDRIRGAVVFDRSGHRIGDVGEVYLDDTTGEPMWITVKTGLFGLHSSLAPLTGSHLEEHGRIVLPHDREVVVDAPRVEERGHLDRAHEDRLYDYYGIPNPQGDLVPGD